MPKGLDWLIGIMGAQEWGNLELKFNHYEKHPWKLKYRTVSGIDFDIKAKTLEELNDKIMEEFESDFEN